MTRHRAQSAHTSSSSTPLARTAANTTRVTTTKNKNTTTTKGNGTMGGGSTSERKHYPKNMTPSHYSQEAPYVSDTTGQPHHSLRGSRPVLFPKTSCDPSSISSSSSADHPPYSSNPNHRPSVPYQFQHTHVTTPIEWMGGDRRSVMTSVTKSSFTPPKDPRSMQPTISTAAGVGGNWDLAYEASGKWVPRSTDLPTSLTPLENLKHRRHSDALHHASIIDSKVMKQQQVADEMFQQSCRTRYERAVRSQLAHVRTSSTSNFFLNDDEARHGLATELSTNSMSLSNAHTMRDKVREYQNAAAQKHTNSRAGLSSRRYRSWYADTSLRLVAPSKQREQENEYTHTFERVMSNDVSTTTSMKEAKSTTTVALEQGAQKVRSTSQNEKGEFVPHFLSKVHESLHNNIRRNIFQNGNTFIDPITPSSKFKMPTFQPRAYNTIPITANITKQRTESTLFAPATEPTQPTLATSQQPTTSSNNSATSGEGGGSGFVGM